jgi:hypothetical protein
MVITVWISGESDGKRQKFIERRFLILGAAATPA